MSNKSDLPPTEHWLPWLLINASLLAGVGIAILYLLMEFGSYGYKYVFVGGVLISLLVGAIHAQLLKKQPYANSWTIITIVAWMVTICSISMLLRPGADALPYAGQVPGAGPLFLCLCVPAIDPLVAVIATFFLANSRV